MTTDTRRGELYFDETGESLGPATTPDSFLATRLRALGSLRAGASHDPPGSEFRSDSRQIFGVWFAVTLTFDDRLLRRVELAVRRADDGKSWADWCESKELARKKWHEEWAAAAFGRELPAKPLDIDGVRVIPEWGDRTPREAEFSWGRVGSYYDAKGGMAYLLLEYA